MMQCEGGTPITSAGVDDGATCLAASQTCGVANIARNRFQKIVG
jgi:hypothetical protein